MSQNLKNKKIGATSNSPKSHGDDKKQIAEHFEDEQKFIGSQGSGKSGTDSELDSQQSDISSDGGDYQDLPIIMESVKENRGGSFKDKRKDVADDPNDLLKSRKIKSNTKFDL